MEIFLFLFSCGNSGRDYGRNFITKSSLLSMIICSEIANAATYRIGDAKGWSFNVENWTQGKKFFPGDVLIFNYDPAALHNVISVNQVSYDTCTLESNFKAYHSVHDQIVLAKGWSNFLSNITGDCDNKIKTQVSAWPVLE